MECADGPWHFTGNVLIHEKGGTFLAGGTKKHDKI